MGRSDDGEFELILGNKQLLSVFFVVVMLLGVFFAMGYIVGKNAAPESTMAKGGGGVINIDPRNPGSSIATPIDPRPPVTSVTPPVKEEPKPAAKEPERPKPVESRKPEPPVVASIEPKKAEPKKVEPKKVDPPPVAQSGGNEPISGRNYLQVVASTRPDCEIIIDVLRRKGFSAVIAPGPSDKLFRVLVGPLADSAAIAKTRSDLEGAGFQKPYLRKF